MARLTPRRLVVGVGIATLAISVVGSPVIVAGATGVGVALKMGVQNTVSAATTLTATTTGFAFTVKNQGTGGGISINVKTGKSPISVSAGAGKATNLDADKLDGLEGAQLQKRVTTNCPSGQALTAIDADGTATCSATGITSLGQLNAIACQTNGLTLIRSYGPFDLACISDNSEPNNTQASAFALEFMPDAVEALTGPTDDDWYFENSSDLCTGSGPYQCAIALALSGPGVTMDVYRDGSLVASNTTQFLPNVASFGSVPEYLIRIHGAQRLPYRLYVD